jgi:hypothetical protein
VVEKREAPAEAVEAPEAQDQTEDEEAAVEPRPMIEVGFCKFSLRVTNVCRDPPSNPFIPPLYLYCASPKENIPYRIRSKDLGVLNGIYIQCCPLAQSPNIKLTQSHNVTNPLEGKF